MKIQTLSPQTRQNTQNRKTQADLNFGMLKVQIHPKTADNTKIADKNMAKYVQNLVFKLEKMLQPQPHLLYRAEKNGDLFLATKHEHTTHAEEQFSDTLNEAIERNPHLKGQISVSVATETEAKENPVPENFAPKKDGLVRKAKTVVLRPSPSEVPPVIGGSAQKIKDYTPH